VGIAPPFSPLIIGSLPNYPKKNKNRLTLSWQKYKKFVLLSVALSLRNNAGWLIRCL